MRAWLVSRIACGMDQARNVPPVLSFDVASLEAEARNLDPDGIRGLPAALAVERGLETVPEGWQAFADLLASSDVRIEVYGDPVKVATLFALGVRLIDSLQAGR